MSNNKIHDNHYLRLKTEGNNNHRGQRQLTKREYSHKYSPEKTNIDKQSIHELDQKTVAGSKPIKHNTHK